MTVKTASKVRCSFFVFRCFHEKFYFYVFIESCKLFVLISRICNQEVIRFSVQLPFVI